MAAENRFLKMLPYISLGTSGASLGVASANFHNSKANREVAEKQRKIEQQSLNALKAIHQTIAEPPKK